MEGCCGSPVEGQAGPTGMTSMLNHAFLVVVKAHGRYEVCLGGRHQGGQRGVGYVVTSLPDTAPGRYGDTVMAPPFAAAFSLHLVGSFLPLSVSLSVSPSPSPSPSHAPAVRSPCSSDLDERLPEPPKSEDKAPAFPLASPSIFHPPFPILSLTLQTSSLCSIVYQSTHDSHLTSTLARSKQSGIFPRHDHATDIVNHHRHPSVSAFTASR